MLSSREPSVTCAAILRHLEEAPRPDYPSPPRGKVLRLALLVSFFRLLIAVLLPVFGLVLFLTPLAARYLTGSNFLKPFKNLFGLAAIWLFVAWHRAVFRKEESGPDELTLSRREDYKLYELADAVADAVGSPKIDEISMSATADFKVEEKRSGGKRTLHLSLSCHNFETLSLVEFTAILAREIAHFGRGHTRHSLRLSRNLRFLRRLDEELTKNRWRTANPVYWALRVFERFFDPLLAAIQRDYVKQADAAAIDLFGAAVFSSSFRKEVQSRLRASELLHSKLEIALESKKHEPDLLTLIGSHRFDAAEHEEYAAEFAELLQRPTRTLDSEPSIRDRLAFATERRAQRSELAGLAELSGTEDAYEFLFGARRSKIEAAISEQIIRRERGHLASEIGLRGEAVDGSAERSLPDVTVLKHSTPIFVMRLISSSFGVLLFGVLMFLVSANQEIPSYVFGLLAGAEVLCVLALLYVFRARALRLHASESGLTIVSLLASTNIKWDEVTGLRCGTSRLSVFASSNGGSQRMSVNGRDEEGRRMADMIMELSPALAYVAWGTGLARVARPSATVALPDRIFQRDGVIHIEGPGQTRIVVEEDDAHHETVRSNLEQRLLPLMLEG